MMLPFVTAAVVSAWWAYDSGLEFAGFHRVEAEQEITRLQNRLAAQSAEIMQLRNEVAQFERKIQIEQASNLATTEQLRSLSDQNVQLQEDLVFFQNLTATRGKDGELGVHRLVLERDKMPGEYHLRMLLVQSGQRAKTFNGHYQLVATVFENGRNVTRLFPQEGIAVEPFNLSFRYYQRIEQSIQLPADAQLDSIQVRVFEQGATEPKIRQSVRLSSVQGASDVQQKT